jgi:hemerythrin
LDNNIYRRSGGFVSPVLCRTDSEHGGLLDEIRDIMDDYETGADADAGQALATTVRDWIVNHFKTKDARLHRLLGV